MNYKQFIESKSQSIDMHGFDPVWMPDFLFDFQKSLVEWSVRKGRSAIFADCGLGKTPMQLVWAENVVRKTNKPVLIITPLSVSAQTVREGEKFGIQCQQSRDGEHYAFIVEQIYRITKPGRLSCVHCMDLKGEGSNSWRDFPGDIIRLHQKIGFLYHSRHTIWKEPLKVAIRTRALGLMHRQLVKDSTQCKAAGADYLLVFRKPGINDNPVSHLSGLTRYAGENKPPKELVEKYRGYKEAASNKLSHYIWQRYASSVWMDIRSGRVLPFRPARETEEEKHVCPLQLDVIERCLTLYSNPGDTLLTPFMGVGSEVCGALEYGRRAIGVELKETYYRQALKNIAVALSAPVGDEADLFSAAENK